METACCGGFRGSGQPGEFQWNGAQELVASNEFIVPHLKGEFARHLHFYWVKVERPLLREHDAILVTHVGEWEHKSPVEVAFTGKGSR